MKKLCFVFLILVSMHCVQADVLEASEWFDPKANTSIGSLNYRVLFGSGDINHVQVKFDELDERLIISYGDCKWLYDYGFCFNDKRFDPENGQGSIDYAKDKEYYQVYLQIYSKESEIVDVEAVRTIETNNIILDEKTTVTIELTGSGSGIIFDVHYVEKIPDGFIVSSTFNAQLVGNEVRWSGTIDETVSRKFTYDLLPQKVVNATLNGTLRHKETEKSYTTELSVIDSSGVFELGVPYMERNSDLFEVIDFVFNVSNILSTSPEAVVMLEVIAPEQLLVLNSQVNHETSKLYREEVTLAGGETELFKLSVKPNTAGPIPLKIRLYKGEEDIFNDEIVFKVPFEELRIIPQLTDLAFALGDTGFASITVWNRDENVALQNIRMFVNSSAIIESIESKPVSSLASDQRTHLGTVHFSIPNGSQEKIELEILVEYETQDGLALTAYRTESLYVPPTIVPEIEEEIEIVTKNSTQGTGTEAGIIKDQDIENSSQSITQRLTDVVRDSISDIPPPEVNLRSALFLSAVAIVLLLSLVYFMKKHMKLEVVDESYEDEDQDHSTSLADNPKRKKLAPPKKLD